MMIGMIDGATRVLGRSQGYLGLPVRDEVMTDTTNGQATPTMTTAWFPTPAEIEAINAGSAIYCNIFGNQHPPIRLHCGDATWHEKPQGVEAASRLLHTLANRCNMSVMPAATVDGIIAQMSTLIDTMDISA